MPILIVPRIPSLMMSRQGREKGTAMARALSTTRQIKEVTNVRLTVVWILWLTPIHRVITNSAREGHLLDPAGQDPHLSSY